MSQDIHETFVEGATDRAPLILLHGTGGSEHDLIPIGQFLAPGAPLLSIRGRVVENGQNRYFRHLPTGGFDLDDLAKETTWLLKALAERAQVHKLDLRQAVVAGYSNGANVAARAMLERPVPFRRALLFHPMSLGQEHPVEALKDARVWLSHGSQDPIVPGDNFAHLINLLATQGAATTIFRHGEGHNLNEHELKNAKQWLHHEEADA